MSGTAISMPARGGRLLKPLEVADFLCVSVQTLAGWRSKRRGPEWIRMSHKEIRYAQAAVEQFVQSLPRGRTQHVIADKKSAPVLRSPISLPIRMQRPDSPPQHRFGRHKLISERAEAQGDSL